MAFKTIVCVIVECDGCGFDYAGDEDLASHYHTVQEAYADLAGRQEWRIAEHGGDTTTLCPQCAKRQECDARGGHQWQPPQLEDGTFAAGFEACKHCDLQRRIHTVVADGAASDHDHDWRYEPMQWRAGETYGPWRFCQICEEGCVLLKTPPVGHPESMTAELDDVADDYLGWLDRKHWPEDAEDADYQAAYDRLRHSKED